MPGHDEQRGRAEGRKRDSVVTELSRRSSAKSRHRWLRFSLDNPAIVVLLALIFTSAMILLVVVDFRPEQEGLEPAKVGTIATRDYRAAKDFVFSRVDEQATLRFREERVAGVAPVYRWQTDIVEQVDARIREAFASMRQGMEEVRAEALIALQQEIAVVARLPRSPGGVYAGAVDGSLRGAYFPRLQVKGRQVVNLDEVEAAVTLWASTHQSEFTSRLLEYVDPVTYGWFVEQRFSPIIERELLEVTEQVLARPIIAHRRDLADAKSIVIQKRRGDEAMEKWTEDELGKIQDLENAMREVDLQMRIRFSAADTPVIGLAALVRQFLQPTLTFDANATKALREEAMSNTADLVAQQHFQRGQSIVDEGHLITQDHLLIYQAMMGETTPKTRLWQRVGSGGFLLLVFALAWVLLRRDLLSRRRARRDVLFLGVAMLFMTLLVRAGDAVLVTVADAWQVGVGLFILFLLPFAAGSMMVRLVLGRQLALVFALVLAVVSGLIVKNPEVILPYALLGGIAGAVVIKQAKNRMLVLQRGVIIGLLSALCALSLLLFYALETSPWDLFVVATMAVGSGLMAAIIVTVGLPVVESLFGYTTSIKLLELANLEHPALKALLLEAPGTYHHSMMVGSLNEAAAEAIGADAVLARVGGYYHDIGKMKNAQYFAENQLCDNPHNRLKPNMSALILKAHVKDGVEMGKRYGLPQDIIDFVATHHGTGRIEFFYQKAKEQEQPDIPEVREDDYRYPGPKPQSRETGICMISDMVEAAARALPDKSPARLKMLVQKLINHKFADGQFDECALTLRDLNEIAKAIMMILNAVYHQRPEYPDQKKERERREARETRDSREPAPMTAAAPKRPSMPAEPAATHSQPSVAGVLKVINLPRGEGSETLAPVGRARSDRSGSGEHRRLEIIEGTAEGSVKEACSNEE